MSIYEEVSKQINELELFLPNELNRFQISILIMYSLFTENPVHALDEIIYIACSNLTKQNIISHTSKFFKGDASITDVMISELTKDIQYYKNKSNFQLPIPLNPVEKRSIW